MKKIIGVLFTMLLLVAISGCMPENDFDSGVSPENENLVESYIRENISELSPEEAVLGGTFYVTSVVFTGPDSALVQYEDGHIALEAKATFTVSDSETVEIKSFEIIPLYGEEREPSVVCVDNCGNGTCEEIVCMGTGCPCAETINSCPEDCE